MSQLPEIITTESNLSPKEEISSLRAELRREQKYRIEAETALLMVDIAQENGDPPPSRMAMITGLAKLAESRDDNTGAHLSRIQHYTTIIAGAYAEKQPSLLPLGEVSIIGAASILHDIGKVGIYDDVLLHSGKFTDKQFEVMKRHTTIGADILLSLSKELGSDPWIDTSVQIALSHHEKWDGSGYPFGLKREDISLPARIVAVADVYDALTSQRVYKKTMTHEDATLIIKKDSGTHFDPEVVDAFLDREAEIKKICERLHLG
ncbi:MAG: HD domain-containing protein [Phycisphaerales bacterium]|nr:HD domain-containing protein [Planctomycetota bacterium]MBL6997720.1 HD domain-containing protein [Phycisphaerales bacterium]